jgi:hypothetical protein
LDQEVTAARVQEVLSQGPKNPTLAAIHLLAWLSQRVEYRAEVDLLSAAAHLSETEPKEVSLRDDFCLPIYGKVILFPTRQ